MSLCTLVYSIILVVTVDSESDDHTFLLQPNTVGCGEDNLIRLEVPKGVIKKDMCKELNIRYGILVHGPFVLENYELVYISIINYISSNSRFRE